MAEAALQECLRHSGRTKTTRLFSARFFFFSCKLNIFRLFFAYVESNSRLRIKQKEIKQIYKFVQARIHMALVSADRVALSPLSDHHLDDMELKQTVSRGRNEV